MTDILGRPIAIGDTILIKGHYSMTLNKQIVVEHITKSNKVRFKVPTHRHVSKGPPNYGYKKVDYVSTLYRERHDCLVINEQLAYNKATFPEMYI